MKRTTLAALVVGTVSAAQAMMAVSWQTPSGLVRADGSTPLLEGGTALVQLIFSPDEVVGSATEGGGTSGDDVVLAEAIADSSTDSAYGQHFAATYTGAFTMGYVYLRVFDTGTVTGAVPVGTAYFTGNPTSVMDIALPYPFQPITEGPFAGGSSVDGLGRYVLNEYVGGAPVSTTPFLEITTAAGNVDNSVSNLLVEGVSTNLAGEITWTHVTYGFSASLEAASEWSFVAPLAEGENVVVVSGTNLLGESASDTVTVIRAAAAAPVLEVSPLSLTVFVEPGGSSTQYIEISNSGSGSFTYTVESDVFWMSPQTSSGSIENWPAWVGLYFDASWMSVGDYTGRLTVAASAAQSPQYVDVVMNVRDTSLGNALDTTNLMWQASTPPGEWHFQSFSLVDGEDSATCTLDMMGGQSWVSTLVQGPALMTFYWGMQSGSEMDQLRFSVDYQDQAWLTGMTPMQMGYCLLEPGQHTVQWTAHRDPMLGGILMAGLDQVIFHPVPALEITTADASVPSTTESLQIAGTNNEEVVGSLTWNNLQGGSGSVMAGADWSFSAGLAVGANSIVVSGQTAYGFAVQDTVTIVRAGAPLVTITTPDQSVGEAVSNLLIEGTSGEYVVGELVWTGSLGGGELAATPTWSFVAGLAPGTNWIVVAGTNGAGEVSQATVQVVRAAAEALAPWLDVSTPDSTELYGVSNMLVSGSTTGLVGQLRWTNHLNGAAGSAETVAAFSVGPVPLAVGTNLIVVWGTNATGSSASDSVVITRGGLGTDLPLVDITNVDLTVGHTVTNWVIGGTANEHVVGQLSWTNSRGGKGTFPASNTWSFLATLKSGTNVFTVSGTNLFAVAATDTVTIVRSNAPPTTYVTVQWISLAGFVKEDGVTPLFEGVPLTTFSLLMDVGPNGMVDPPDYCNTSQQVTHVVGGDDRILTWSSAPNEYAMGFHGGYTVQSTNALTVYARLMQDDTVAIGDRYFDGLPVTVQPQVGGIPEVYDMTAPAIEPVMLDKVVAPCGGGSPALDITNANATVRYSVSNQVIGGTSAWLAGQLVWSNAANSLSGTAAAGASFSVGPVPLAVGTNVIVVRGTNATGSSASDSVVITRGGLGTDLPLVDITNLNESVANAMSNRMIGGTANAHVVGQVRWTNSLGGAGGFAAASSWTFMASLNVGTNLITVRGSNYWGEASTDLVTIIRGANPASPLIAITNADGSVSAAVSNLTVGGTASNVAGQLRWTNSLSGLVGTLTVGSTWSFTCPLMVGTNVITVTGTNGTGASASDSLTMVRLPLAGVQSVYDLEADFRADANLEDAVWSYRYQSGSLVRDGNYELLPVFTPTNLGGIQGLSGWQKMGSLPMAGCNLTGLPLTNSAFRIEAGHSDVHPTSSELVVVSWQAPTSGVVRVQFQFADYDAGGGDGVRWYVAQGSSDLASGTLANGETGAVVFLSSMGMTAGEFLHFIVDPGPGGSGFDSTRIMARIELGAQLPQVQIATADQTVENATSNLLVEGSATNVSGSLTWQNSLGGSGTLAVSGAWSFVASLGEGTNRIVVRGSNAWSEVAADTVTVVRLPYVAPGPQQVWTNVGSGVSGGAARCWDMAFTTNGELLIAGDFTSPGGHVALWNGSSWSSIGNMSQTANAVARDRDGRFVVGGSFITAGGVTVNRIAAWNGSSWASLGTGLNGAPADIVRGGDGDLYVAGQFTSASGVSVANVARWNGSSWSALGSGVGGVARALATDSAGNLYVGGDFTNAGAVAVQRIAKWNGATWTNLGSGMNNSVHGLVVDGAGRLFAVGSFTTAGGVSAQRVAMWNGTVWTNLGSGLNASAIGIVGDLDGNVYVGGDFTTAGGVAAQRVAKWDGASWSALSAGMDGFVYTLSIDEWGYLYAGGGFTTADGRTANGVARWNYPLAVSHPRLEVLGTNGAALANNEAPSVGKGTDFGLMPVGAGITNRLAITNASSDALVISAATLIGPGAASFVVQAMPDGVAAGTRSNFALVFQPGAAGVQAASVQIINDGPISPYVIQVQGTGVGSPQVVISTPDQAVAHAVAQATVGGTSANLAGHMAWTNELTHLAGSLASAGAWSVSELALGVGTNVITVKGSNALGQTASDSVAIVRVAAPLLVVTNAGALVRYSVTQATVGGTAGSGVAGSLRWTNSLTGGSGTAAVASPFSIAGIPLEVGANVITVRGTNLQGDVASDSVTITRGGLGTDLPVVEIGNADETVDASQSNLFVGGTANVHVVGELSWNNSLAGGGATFEASTNWGTVVSLLTGTNVITVTGTNLLGESASDTVTITRAAAAAAPVLVVSPLSLTVFVEPGGSSTQYIEISNSGSGTFDYTVESDVFWMSPQTSSGSIENWPAWIGLFFDASWMSVGDYTGRLTVAANAAQAPQYVDVVMNVRDTSLGNALDTTNLMWQTSQSPGDWRFQAFSLVDGEDSATCTLDLMGGAQSWVSTFVQGPALMTFYWGMQSGSQMDQLRFSVDYQDQAWLNGMTPVQMGYCLLEPGQHTVQWSAYREPMFGGIVMASLDQVIFHPVPVLEITTADAFVPSTTESLQIAGSNSEEVVGSLVWNNLQGGSGSVAAGADWSFAADLAMGANTIVVSGQTVYGFALQDTVTIVRAGAPLVTITTPDQSVGAAVSNLLIEGTAGEYVAGELLWSNSLGGAGSFAATDIWSFVASLAVGTNVITVRGSNLWSETSEDSVVVERAPAGPVNQPPYWTSVPVTTATAGRRYVYRLTAVDPEGDPLSFSGSSLPAWLQVTAGSGEVFGTNVVSTIAGSAAVGFAGDGGAATNAALLSPHCLAIDAAGQVFISDSDNHRVRKVAANGVITTIAGTGAQAYNGDGIAATSAALAYPMGLALDEAGRLYLADHFQNRVRRIDTNGLIATIAGNGTAGFAGDGGPATNASLQAVADVALDQSGNLFLADVLNNRIRRVATNGTITTVAGNGSQGFSGDGGAATSASLNRPYGVSVDRHGNLFIADHFNHRVRKVGTNGVITTVAGNGVGTYAGDGGAATSGSLKYPYDVALDENGNLYIADNENHRIRKVGTNGIISTLAGRGVATFGGDGGAATNARVAYPSDVEFDGQGNLYIADAANRRIRKVAGGAGGWMLAGTPGGSDAGVTNVALYVSDGELQVPQSFSVTVGQLLAPTNLAAQAAGLGRIDLSWTDNNDGETGYTLDRRASTDAVWVVIATLPANTSAFADTGLAAGQSYMYRILAHNLEGATAPSAVASATTLSVPAAPANLTATAASTSSVVLTWSDASDNEQGFEMQRRTGAAGSWSGLVSLPAGSTVWGDAGLQPNTIYAYRLRATNAAGVSAFSAEAGVTTPPDPSDTDCGHLLLVTSTNLVFDGVASSLPVVVPPATIVGGTLDCAQSSPRGAGTVHRVALGFRNELGQAVASPRELTLLYGTPGCPGRVVTGVSVPEGLRVPTNAGLYRLWVESYVSASDPRGLFAAQVRTGETALARSLGSVTVQPRPPGEVEVRVLSANGLVGQPVLVPVLVSSTGGESAIAFTLTYNSEVLSTPLGQAGADAPAVWITVNTGTPGRAGCLLLMPGEETLAAGTKRVADLVFSPVGTGVSSLAFADTPVAREVTLLDPEATPTVTWVGADVTIRPAGYEGDLAPRPGGDLQVNESDRLLLQLITAGLDAPADSNEFRKADCAPRATSGDGRINVSDLRQVYRYANGYDALQPAAGPWAATNVPPPPGRQSLSLLGARAVSLADVATNRGDVVRLPVTLDAQGDESALGFSLEYDPDLLTYLDLQLLGPATNAQAAPAVQRAEEGVVGLALAWPANQVVPAGVHTVAELLFASAAGGQSVTTTVVLGDDPMPRGVAGTDAGALSADFSVAAQVSLLVADSLPGAPAAPTDLAAVAVATNQINLSWTDAASNENGYRLLRRAGAGAWTEIVILSANVSSYEDIGLAAKTSYRYLVEAFNAAGSSLSAEASAQTWAPIDAWRRTKFGTIEALGPTADGGDWDGDGLPNLVEYALGLDPRVDNYPLMPFAWQLEGGVVIGTNRFLTAAYDLLPGAAADAGIHMQVGTNLLIESSADMIPVDESVVDGAVRRRVRSDQPLGARSREFLRMMVEPE